MHSGFFKQLEGFGSYGFPESHAASFALLVYVSSWIKYYYPDIFAGALLNSMPMGFYQPAQIVIDARKHGVEVRPVDANLSAWDNTLEEKSGNYCALRLGFRQVKGLREEDMLVLISGRIKKYTILLNYAIQVFHKRHLKISRCGCIQFHGARSRRALWEISTGNDQPAGLFAGKIPILIRRKYIIATDENIRTCGT